MSSLSKKINIIAGAQIDTLKAQLDTYSNEYNTITDSESKIIVIDNNRIFNLLKENKIEKSDFESNYYKYLDYGLVIFVKENEVLIYNDIYGAYPLFQYNNDKGDFSIQNYFDKKLGKKLDELSVYDFILFNHFVGENTLYTNIKRMDGGMKISIDDRRISLNRLYDWEKLFSLFNSFSSKHEPYVYLKNALNEALNNKESILTLTGGYDSRLLLGTLLADKQSFTTITWGLPNNSQTFIAKQLSDKFGIRHADMELNQAFIDKIPDYIEDVLDNYSETPFIIDVPQFIYMCENLGKHANLICGFMGSEIIRGPSYSSQVTLTAFAAKVNLSTTRDEIKALLLAFNSKYTLFEPEKLESNLEVLIDRYQSYSKIDIKDENKNYNVFKYLFFEKYRKVYGQFIKIHYNHDINLVNPYMDFEFIASIFKENKAFTHLTPYENSAFDNFKLYRIYAKQMQKLYPPLMKTTVDRGYKVKDLITIYGYLKLIPTQFFRKIKKSNKKKIVKVVDSFEWNKDIISKLKGQENQQLSSVINHKEIVRKIEHIETIDDLEKIKIQLYSGLVNHLER